MGREAHGGQATHLVKPGTGLSEGRSRALQHMREKVSSGIRELAKGARVKTHYNRIIYGLHRARASRLYLRGVDHNSEGSRREHRLTKCGLSWTDGHMARR